MEDKGTLKATTFTNTGGESQPVPGGTSPGNPTKPHPGSGAKSEPGWPGYGNSPKKGK